MTVDKYKEQGLQNPDGYNSKALMAIPRDAKEPQEEKVGTLGMPDTVLLCPQWLSPSLATKCSSGQGSSF